MRINGEWLRCVDGGIRPVVRGEIQGGDGVWRELEMLVDTGADRTLLCAQVYEASHFTAIESDRRIGGLGGLIGSAIVQTQLRMIRDDGQQAFFRGQFAACTKVEDLDMSILGRDILDMFALIVDRPADCVSILGGLHRYAIRQTAT